MLEARGAFKKDPQRRRHGEPVVDTPLGPPPDHFGPSDHKHFNEILMLAPKGVLTSADQVAVEQLAVLITEMREDYEKMSVAKLTLLNKLLGQFGMTPSDRARLSIEKPKDANPFDTLG